MPLILGPDKKRLSKRHGATSVMEYQRLGYLPEAMVNFLALLGWSPGDDRELFTRDELIAAFTLEGISGGNAVFNPEKLDWFNQQHIMRLPPERAGSPGRAAAARGRAVERRAARTRRSDWFLERAGARSAARQEARAVRGRAAAVPRRKPSTTIRRPSRSIFDRPDIAPALASLIANAERSSLSTSRRSKPSFDRLRPRHQRRAR